MVTIAFFTTLLGSLIICATPVTAIPKPLSFQTENSNLATESDYQAAKAKAELMAKPNPTTMLAASDDDDGYVWNSSTKPRLMHSHNDEQRNVALFDSFKYGATSVEADTYLTNSGKLVIGHDANALNSSVTLDSLYVQPLLSILQVNGSIYQSSPEQTLYLFVDLKNTTEDASNKFYDALHAATDPLRSAGFLTTFDGSSTVSSKQITVVATGSYPDSLVTMDGKRDIFVDAPLSDLEGKEKDLGISFSPHISPIASANLFDATGWVYLLVTDEVRQKIESQITAAHNRGLKARYYGNPLDPAGAREDAWNDVLNPVDGGESGVGTDLINTDYLQTAADWLDANT